MRNQKVDQENIDQNLFSLFSEFGYDGASMELMSKATGLKKASLYHRFPKGKMEMAQHVLKIVEQGIQANIVSVLTAEQVKPEIRLKKAIQAIDQFYNGGANNCLLRTLTIGADATEFKEGVTHCFALLTNAFTSIAVELGSTAEAGEKKAKNVVMLIQGSLVLAGATGDKSYFKNCLSEIPAFIGT